MRILRLSATLALATLACVGPSCGGDEFTRGAGSNAAAGKAGTGTGGSRDASAGSSGSGGAGATSGAGASSSGGSGQSGTSSGGASGSNPGGTGGSSGGAAGASGTNGAGGTNASGGASGSGGTTAAGGASGGTNGAGGASGNAGAGGPGGTAGGTIGGGGAGGGKGGTGGFGGGGAGGVAAAGGTGGMMGGGAGGVGAGGVGGKSGSGGGSGVSPECDSNTDCRLHGDCCNCTGLTTTQLFPVCPDITCLIDTCQSMGISQATCYKGQCVALADCDLNHATCAAPVPACDNGRVPSVVGACYGPCVDPSDCRSVMRCTDCRNSQVCVNYKEAGFTLERRCLEVPLICWRRPHVRLPRELRLRQQLHSVLCRRRRAELQLPGLLKRRTPAISLQGVQHPLLAF